jgi:hypothetical protein
MDIQKSQLMNSQKVQRLEGLLTDIGAWINDLDDEYYESVDAITTSALFQADVTISVLYELLDEKFQEQLDTIELDGQRKLL